MEQFWVLYVLMDFLDMLGLSIDSKYTVLELPGVYNFYWDSIVHTILPSVILSSVPGHKKKFQKQLTKIFEPVRRADNNKIMVRC
jgi:hypothetical protein